MLLLTKENAKSEIFEPKKNAIIDVFADWCGPCQQMNPIFEELASEFGQYVFAKINIDEQRDLTTEYGITSVPTFIFIKNGDIVAKETGYMSKEDFIEKINMHLG